MYPALAVVDALGKRVKVLWVGSEGGMEASLVKREGYAFEGVPAAGVHGVGLLNLPSNLMRLTRGVAAARKVIRQFRPDALFFTGGFVGIPVVLAGRGLPKAVYVPDIEPALASRLIGRTADVITVTTEASCSHYASNRRVVVTGYPTRPELKTAEKDESRRHLNLDLDKQVVLVFGGSLGARSINQALWGCLTNLLEQAQVVHITGELDWPQVRDVESGLPQNLAGNYHSYPYLHEEMASALAAADLVVSRAGAATLGEYPLLGLPSVLVPYPHAWRYQEVNAQYLVSHGAAVQLADEDLASKLLLTILELLGDPDRLSGMATAAKEMANPDAAQMIAAEIESLVRLKGIACG